MHQVQREGHGRDRRHRPGDRQQPAVEVVCDCPHAHEVGHHQRGEHIVSERELREGHLHEQPIAQGAAGEAVGPVEEAAEMQAHDAGPGQHDQGPGQGAWGQPQGAPVVQRHASQPQGKHHRDLRSDEQQQQGRAAPSPAAGCEQGHAEDQVEPALVGDRPVGHVGERRDRDEPELVEHGQRGDGPDLELVPGVLVQAGVMGAADPVGHQGDHQCRHHDRVHAGEPAGGIAAPVGFLLVGDVGDDIARQHEEHHHGTVTVGPEKHLLVDYQPAVREVHDHGGGQADQVQVDREALLHGAQPRRRRACSM